MIKTKQTAPVKSRGKSCKYGDPLCPCPDGDPCHYEGKNPMLAPVKRAVGRPPSGKIMVNLRLDPDIVERFKATGKGWQARINEALKL